jgi:predicted amidophosphoribosyltransferase
VRQVDLTRDERLQNVRGAFQPWRIGPFARVLLIDDVTTTGATLSAASDALRLGGVRVVRTLVLATRVFA